MKTLMKVTIKSLLTSSRICEDPFQTKICGNKFI